MSLAERLLDHAAAVLPAAQRDWAAGMKAELSAIDAPGEAVVFAAGCVLAAYRRRIDPMRIALVSARLFVAALAMLAAAFHVLPTSYWLLVLADLKLSGMEGWAGRLGMFRGASAEQAIDGLLQFQPWNIMLTLIMGFSFAAAAWFVVKGRMRGLFVAVLVGALAQAARSALLMAFWPAPSHLGFAWLNIIAFGLLLVAGLVFFGLDRWTRPKPAAA
ncbi:hypothetical protein SGCZBJ_12330 [Caulobacter zeae]|uniref:Uncharacterized protein n=1 Tax=Caulobacter zeae TaxID=2055137 RepID=A0A2N5DG24_9CAUL|nr:hypothetical protein [Caulobacter zeae]PLR25019.1 hypothetical protein SGCZBJ_12330 [Caulobacter zeae]